MKKAFTLIEVMLVVIILAILGAIVFPTFQSYMTKAKESAAKEDVRRLRSIIEAYATQHKDVPPGYPDGNPAVSPSSVYVILQLQMVTNIDGQTGQAGTPGYDYGPYFRQMPENPITNQDELVVIGNGQSFPVDPTVSNGGWIYQPSIKTIKLNCEGTDSDGIRYFDY